MQLAILTAILATLAMAESGGGPVGDVAWRLALVALAPLVAPLAALIGARHVGLAHDCDDAHDEAVGRLHLLVTGIWIVAVALILFVAQWPRIVTSNWQLAAWPLVDELIILAPVIGSLLLVWTAFFRIEQAAQPWRKLVSYLWRQARHYLGLVLLPPLAVIAVVETLGALEITTGNADTTWWLMLPMMLTILVLMPLAVRNIWPTRPLAVGPLRDLLETICRSRRCAVRDILIWQTGGTMANAAVVGISSHLRYVLLTDALLARLSPLEIAAVVRHEVAHLRRWHLPLRLALLVLPLAAWLAIKHAWPDSESLSAWATASLGGFAKTATTCGPPLALLLYAVVVVGRYSRLLEHDADLDACLGDNGNWDSHRAADFQHALIGVCGRHRADFLSEWLHPPLHARLTFLERAAASGTYIATFRARLCWIAVAIGSGYFLAALVLAL